MQGGQGPCRVAAQAVASLYGGDDALEVGAVEQLRQLQETMAQDEELAEGHSQSQGQGQTKWIMLVWGRLLKQLQTTAEAIEVSKHTQHSGCLRGITMQSAGPKSRPSWRVRFRVRVRV